MCFIRYLDQVATDYIKFVFRSFLISYCTLCSDGVVLMCAFMTEKVFIYLSCPFASLAEV